eukprot:5102068-Pleurochrysis_carterae.AAC.6
MAGARAAFGVTGMRVRHTPPRDLFTEQRMILLAGAGLLRRPSRRRCGSHPVEADMPRCLARAWAAPDALPRLT